MKKFLSLLLIASFVYTSVLQNINFAKAQTINQSNCLNLSYNMGLASNDSETNGEVTKLQLFLNSKGFMNHIPTGYFGYLTLSALANYQASNNIFPSAGYLGPITRANINNNTCVVYVPTSNSTSSPTFYCSINGAFYANQDDYKNNCVSTIASYFSCAINGQKYSSQSEYDSKCTSPNVNTNILSGTGSLFNMPQYFCYANNMSYYDLASYNINCKSSVQVINYLCSLNNQNYTSLADYNKFCVSPNLSICSIDTIYPNTNSCVCQSPSSFVSKSGGYKCMSTQPITCSAADLAIDSVNNQNSCNSYYYCKYDGLYYSNMNSCTQNICSLNVTYQGGGFAPTNDCSCPVGSTRIYTENNGEIYKWKCVI